MFNGEKIIDIHGHHSTPPHFRAYAYNIIALRMTSGGLVLPEGPMQEAQERHLKMMDDRQIDVQFISARPVAMMHWEQPLIQNLWAKTTNDVGTDVNAMFQTWLRSQRGFIAVAKKVSSSHDSGVRGESTSAVSSDEGVTEA